MLEKFEKSTRKIEQLLKSSLINFNNGVKEIKPMARVRNLQMIEDFEFQHIQLFDEISAETRFLKQLIEKERAVKQKNAETTAKGVAQLNELWNRIGRITKGDILTVINSQGEVEMSVKHVQRLKMTGLEFIDGRADS